MNSFVVLKWKNIKKMFLLILTAALAVTIIWIEKNNLTVFATRSPAAVFNVPTKDKVIALTFDISWGEKRAKPILDILKRKKVRNATFFLSSPWSKSHPEIVKKIVDAGYEVGSHGHKHENYSQLSNNDIRKQILTADQILKEMVGQSPRLIRLPNGDFDKRVLKIADQLHYKVIQWDTDSLDWKNPGVSTIISRVVNQAHPGDIVLLHASDSCKQTAIALPVIINELQKKGYHFVTVSQLISTTDTKSKTVRDRTAWANYAFPFFIL